MVLLMGMFGTAQPALLSFPSERPVFLREYSTNHYSVVSYFMSRLTMECVITALQVLVAVSSEVIWFFQKGVFQVTDCCLCLIVEYHYVFHDRFPTSLWHLLWSGLLIGHGKHGHRGLPWLRR
jgi:hypothetical protein